MSKFRMPTREEILNEMTREELIGEIEETRELEGLVRSLQSSLAQAQARVEKMKDALERAEMTLLDVASSDSGDGVDEFARLIRKAKTIHALVRDTTLALQALDEAAT